MLTHFIEAIAPDTNLSPRELEILRLRFMERKTLEEVGKLFNVTRERIRQIEARALMAIRFGAQPHGRD